MMLRSLLELVYINSTNKGGRRFVLKQFLNETTCLSLVRKNRIQKGTHRRIENTEGM